MVLPPYMHPFVLAVEPAQRRRQGNIDVHTARVPAGVPRPVVVFVHGGPLPADVKPTPRDWPTFLGYGALAAASGVVGVTVDHRLHDIIEYSVAAEDVASAVEQARGLDGVDPDRVGLWFFSGGGLLAADWLAAPPPWLCCVAMTYPVLAPPPGWDVEARFDPVAAASTATKLPMLLTGSGTSTRTSRALRTRSWTRPAPMGRCSKSSRSPAGSMVSTASTTPRNPERLWRKP